MRPTTLVIHDNVKKKMYFIKNVFTDEKINDNDMLMAVVGQFDQNLKSLSKLTSTDVYFRGNSITCKGEKEQLTIFCDAIKFLINKYFLTNIIEKEDILLSVKKNIEFDDISFRIKGSNFSPDMLEVASMARSDQRLDLITHSAKATLEARSFPNGAHFSEVEIDPETGVVKVVSYTVVDDFGNLINPMLAEGQVHGGVGQGIGQAVYERVVYDEDGQLLTATFMDYAMPRAKDLPFYKFESKVSFKFFKTFYKKFYFSTKK